LLIKKGEIYKEHIGQTRKMLEKNVLKDCTFRPVLNDERNRRSGSRSKVRDLIQATRSSQRKRNL
jgi:hypothetical protein